MKVFALFSRKIFTITVMSFFCVTSVYAGGESCTMDNGMSEELTTYLRTADALLSRIGDEASKVQCGIGTDGGNSASASTERAQSTIVGSINERVGFSNFATSGRFFVDMVLKTEIPVGISRDHEQLGRELEHINSMIEIVHGRCAENTVASSNISTDTVYDTNGKTFGNILTDMLKNQVDMMNFYRETVLGDRTDNKYDFKLVGNPATFRSNLQSHYGPNAQNDCKQKSDFMKSIKMAFTRIGDLGDGIGKGMKEWDKASTLLTSNSTNPEYAETERNTLRNELSNQGMNTKGSQTMMNNLAKYNGETTTEGVTGFVSSVGERVFQTGDQFAKIYEGLKKKLLSEPQSTDKYMETSRAIITLEIGINADILKDYEYAKSRIGVENATTDQTVGDLIDTHILLESTNRFVSDYVKISEKVCKAQASDKGNCSYH